MSLEENKNLIREFLETLSGKDKPSDVVEKFTVDEALKKQIEEYDAAFPRYELAIEDMIAEGDRVAVRLTFRGTHRGELMGIPPTGKRIECDVIDIMRVAGGKCVEHWHVMDQLGLMMQLGAVSLPG